MKTEKSTSTEMTILTLVFFLFSLVVLFILYIFFGLIVTFTGGLAALEVVDGAIQNILIGAGIITIVVLMFVIVNKRKGKNG